MKGDIFYSFKRMDNQFGTPVRVCSTSTVSMFPYLAVENNILHLIWQEDENKIYHTCKNGYKNGWSEPKVYIITTIGGFFGVKFAISSNKIGLIFNGFILPATGEDNYEIFYGETPLQ